MHSTIFQITTERLDKDNFIDETTFESGDYSFYDYCGNISEQQRKEAIQNLAEHLLPSGMFSLVDDDCIIYNDGAEEWKTNWVKQIHQKTQCISPNNVALALGSFYQLEQTLKNPLDIGSRFCTEGYSSSYTVESGEFMKLVCSLEPGTRLFIGGVLDYHW